MGDWHTVLYRAYVTTKPTITTSIAMSRAYKLADMLETLCRKSQIDVGLEEFEIMLQSAELLKEQSLKIRELQMRLDSTTVWMEYL